ncbi:MAG TPA: rhodanese-like domain-containing protein [Candidatus Binatus sp.]|nr:rhodanese-like domain-containing protein [Candidatus Binatus sp.]
MEIPQTTTSEAHHLLNRHSGAVYLDVRTEPEFEAGHPVGALNVPVVFFDPATRQPTPNPEFVAIVERAIPRSATVLVGCQSGARSQRACELLAQAGYTDVTNVRGGFGGARDPSGRVVSPGWRDAGLPVETGATPGASYADLKKK